MTLVLVSLQYGATMYSIALELLNKEGFFKSVR